MVNSVHFPPRCVNLKTISLPTCFGQERYLGSNDDYSSNMKNNQKAWWISRAAAEKTRNTALCRFAPGTKADTILVKSGEGNGNPLQCSCLENPRDGGAWWAAVYEAKQSRTRLSNLAVAAWFRWGGFPGGSVVKNPPANTGDTRAAGLILWSGRCPGEGNGNLFQYSCLENPMDRGPSWTTAHGVTNSWTQLSRWANMLSTILAHTSLHLEQWSCGLLTSSIYSPCCQCLPYLVAIAF